RGEITGRVEHREIFGDESIVYISAGKMIMAVKHSDTPPEVGNKVRVNIKRFYIFNEKGENLKAISI
ncbi:MAG: TOBE domain-containing protein, partial [candidate division WOR-3 bacterium]